MTDVRPGVLKIEADHTNRCVHVGGKVISRPTFIRNYALNIPEIIGYRPQEGCIWKPPGKPERGNKEYNQDLARYLGVSPTKWAKVFNGKARDVWVRPIEWYVNRLARGMRGRLDLSTVESIWRYKSILDQARKDGIENTVPVLLALGRSPEAAKNTLGRSRWRRIAKNSFSRNKLLFWYSLDALNIPSTAIPYLHRCRGDVEALEWACRNRDCPLKNLDRIATFAHLYDDTERMADIAGEPFNPKWGLRRMREEHNRVSRAITARQYSDKPFALYHEIGDLSVSEDGWTGTYLKSPLEVANEGQTMRHCVASYVSDAKRGSYAVFSIRSPDGERYSTLGLDITPDRHGRMRVVTADEHLCAMNEDVEDYHAERIAELVEIELRERLNELRKSA